MSYKKFPLCASSLATGLGMLALTLLFGLQPASGEEASADPSSPPMAMDHSGHASAGHENHQMGDAQTPMTGESETHAADHSTHQGANAHHHHHPVPAVTKRSLASYSLPDVTMVDQNGKRVSLREMLSPDEPVMLNFIFTTCTTICPVMTATFAQVQKGLGSNAERIRMVSVSIDPEQDRPSALAAYAKRFHAGPQWEFLTGTLEDSIAVQKAFDTYRDDKMNHAPVTLLRATPEDEWIRYDGFASAADLLKEAHGMLPK